MGPLVQQAHEGNLRPINVKVKDSLIEWSVVHTHSIKGAFDGLTLRSNVIQGPIDTTGSTGVDLG